MNIATISATDLKATLLAVLDRVAAREIDRIEVTKRGKVVAIVTPPAPDAAAADSWFGSMRDQTIIPAGVDLTEPAFDGVMDAELGILHR